MKPPSAERNASSAQHDSLAAYMRDGDVPDHLRDPLTEQPYRAPVQLSAWGPAISIHNARRWLAGAKWPPTDPYRRPIDLHQVQHAHAQAAEIDRLRLRAQLSWRAQGDIERALATLWLRRFCQSMGHTSPLEALRLTSPAHLPFDMNTRAGQLGLDIVLRQGRLVLTGTSSRVIRRNIWALVEAGANLYLAWLAVAWMLQGLKKTDAAPVTATWLPPTDQLAGTLAQTCLMCAVVGGFERLGHRRVETIASDAHASVSVALAVCVGASHLAGPQGNPSASTLGVCAGMFTKCVRLYLEHLRVTEQLLRDQLEAWGERFSGRPP